MDLPVDKVYLPWVLAEVFTFLFTCGQGFYLGFSLRIFTCSFTYRFFVTRAERGDKNCGRIFVTYFPIFSGNSFYSFSAFQNLGKITDI